jgi:ArsR family transcriptional regulator, arsenate/arsenite/antimonite-responsive transcriptional repressor
MRIVDVVRKSAPEPLCQCELSPLFDISQPALSKHLRVLVSAGVLGSERKGIWTYYYERSEARKELTQWLS